MGLIMESLQSIFKVIWMSLFSGSTDATRRWPPALILLAASMSGCNMFGPHAIATGRAVYNEVINRTADEELLNMIVRERYSATYGMLAVSSIAANIRGRASIGAEVGVGPDENYSGNLVPFSGGIAFEDNPTISYVPLGGEKFMQQLLTPISLEEAMLLSRGLKRRRAVFLEVLIRSVNGIENPHTFPDPNPKNSAAFRLFTDLWVKLRIARVLLFGRQPDGEFFAVFHPENPEEEALCAQLLDLLKIQDRPLVDKPLQVPLEPATTQAVVKGARDRIVIETASVVDILRAAGQSMEIPQEHLKAGVVRPPELGDEGATFLKILSGPEPLAAAVAIQYRAWWYYIADSDNTSKETFQLLRTLIGMRLHRPGDTQSAPILTIPVS